MAASVFFDCFVSSPEKGWHDKLNNRTDGNGTNVDDEAISEDEDFDRPPGPDKDTAPQRTEK